MSRPARMGGILLGLTIAGLLGSTPEAKAQFSDPCSVGCALTLGATSYLFATGAAAIVGRATGGLSTVDAGILTWGAGFVAAAGAGMALSRDGDVQRRAVYGSAIGAAAGALLGLTAESLVGESSAATRLAATLIGGAIGVAAGGVIGAITYEGVADTSGPAMAVVAPTKPPPAFVVRIGVGR